MSYYSKLFLILVVISGALALSAVRYTTNPELNTGNQFLIWRNETYRGPNRIIYYHVNRNIDNEFRSQIVRATRKIESVSCLSFKEATTDQKYFINVTSEEGGCFSAIHYQNLIPQLNLQKDSCFNLNVIVHEFLNALEFLHQQSADDTRDDYVKILSKNMEKRMEEVKEDAIGQRLQLSERDIRKLNAMFNCQGV